MICHHRSSKSMESNGGQQAEDFNSDVFLSFGEGVLEILVSVLIDLN